MARMVDARWIYQVMNRCCSLLVGAGRHLELGGWLSHELVATCCLSARKTEVRRPAGACFDTDDRGIEVLRRGSGCGDGETGDRELWKAEGRREEDKGRVDAMMRGIEEGGGGRRMGWREGRNGHMGGRCNVLDTL
jgi:hypothetical protein